MTFEWDLQQVAPETGRTLIAEEKYTAPLVAEIKP